jgi:DNA-binding NarL/FixJ family response regulator
MIKHVQARGHPVVEAGSAEEALALVERTRIGVLMANAGIAQARDFWLIRQVKSFAPEIKIYVISDTLSEAEGREAIKRGATGYSDTGRLPELLENMDGDRKETDEP